MGFQSWGWPCDPVVGTTIEENLIGSFLSVIKEQKATGEKSEFHPFLHYPSPKL